MAWPHPLRSLSKPDLRLFFGGQTVSLLGSWAQPVAMSWLTWRLTHSAEMLGLVTFLSQLPVFLLSFHGGVVADRLPRKRLVLAANFLLLVQAVLLAAVTFAGVVAPWQLLSLSVLLGLGNAFEFPARNALIADLAAEQTANAVALYATCVTVMRAIGPTVGGYVVATWGEAWCFSLNAVSFLAAVGALVAIKVPRRRHSAGAAGAEGVSQFIRASPVLFAAVIAFAWSSLLGIAYPTLLPVFASKVLNGGPDLLGRLLASTGCGAIVASVAQLVRKTPRDRRAANPDTRDERIERRSGAVERRVGSLDRRLGIGGVLLGAGLIGLSLCHSEWLAFAALFVGGFGQVTQTVSTLTLLQGLAPARLRGRVMGLFTAIFIGVPPFGALAMGWAATAFGVLPTLGTCGLATLLVSVGYELHRRLRPRPAMANALGLERESLDGPLP
jgi:MFS family permease